MDIECISAAELFIVKLFDWIVAEYQSILQMSDEGVDSSGSDWEFISSTVKAIFRELQLLQAGGQLNTSPGVETWAMMSTMKLQ